MAKQNESGAYDFSLFEPKAEALPEPSAQPGRSAEPEQENKILEMPKEHIAKIYRVRRRVRNRSAVKNVALILSGAAICVLLVFGQVRLAELTEQTETTAKQLTEAESLYTQYQMKTDSQLSPTAIEQYAADKLGMTKSDQTQMEYIELSSKDKGEVIQAEDSNWFVSAWNFIVNLLS